MAGSSRERPAQPAQAGAGGPPSPRKDAPVQDGTTRRNGATTAAADGAAMAGEAHPSWHRVVLKLSGEAFAGGDPLGISPDAVVHIAKEVSAAAQEGIQGAAVVGGGNIFRRAGLSPGGIDPSRADYIGIMCTGINCPARQAVLKK